MTEKNKIFKTICAWCKTVISEKPAEKNSVSHGICENCRDIILKIHEKNDIHNERRCHLHFKDYK